ncbi:MAG: TMEM175 family protein [Pseudonocardia sp.]|nr:TMEM175 family protein [Pseudonocardia sp.]
MTDDHLLGIDDTGGSEPPGRREAFDSTDRGAADRLTFFSDAVVAIAMTLLAIELPVPQGDTAAELVTSFTEEWYAYLAFLISFAVIARHWISHHRTFRYVGRASGAVVWLNMAWLLMIVLTPFLTKLITEKQLDGILFGVYAVAQALQTTLFALIIVVLGRGGMFLPGTPRHILHRGWVHSAIAAAAFLISIPFFPLIGAWSFALWGLIPAVLERVSDRTGFSGPEG